MDFVVTKSYCSFQLSVWNGTILDLLVKLFYSVINIEVFLALYTYKYVFFSLSFQTILVLQFNFVWLNAIREPYNEL